MFVAVASEEEIMIQDMARKFAEKELAPHARTHEAARAVNQDVIAAYVETGLDAAGQLTSSEDGLSVLAKVMLLEELAAADPGAALALDRFGYARPLLQLAGQNDLVNELSDNLAARGVLIVDADERLEVAEGAISGTVPWVAADQLESVAIVHKGAAYLVRSGFQLTAVRPCGLDACGGSSIEFDRAKIDLSLSDRELVSVGVAEARLAAAALLIGAARGALDYAVAYSQEREAFGKPIAHHQGLAFLISEMTIALGSARALLWRATAARETDAFVDYAANAFVEAAEQALFVAPNAVQILGGHGFVRDFLTEKWMRDIRTLTLLFGGRDAADIQATESVLSKKVCLA